MAPFQPREGLDERHDVTEENDASSNTPHGVGGDPQVAPFQPCEGLDERHDVTEENSASSNTPHGVGDKLRHKQDRDIESQERTKVGFYLC